jgi:hypothetical protein
MSQFQEFQPDQSQANDLPPACSGGNGPIVPSNPGAQRQPQQERLRHVLYGSLEAIDITIKNLHARHYADPGDWCDPIPVRNEAAQPSGAEATDTPRQWMVIMTKILLIE